MDSNLIYYNKSPHLSEQFCQHVINKFEADERKHEGVVGAAGRVDHNVKQSIDLNITDFSEYENENMRFKKALDNATMDYKYLMNDMNDKIFPFYDCAPGVRNSGFQIQRTDPGGGYKWHSDEHWYSIVDKTTMTCKTWMRGMTYIFYLNDVEHDGYTEFVDGTKIQPKAGHYLLFPSTWTYVHRGFPPKDEVKYICTGWIYGAKITNVKKQQVPPEAQEFRPLKIVGQDMSPVPKNPKGTGYNERT